MAVNFNCDLQQHKNGVYHDTQIQFFKNISENKLDQHHSKNKYHTY